MDEFANKMVCVTPQNWDFKKKLDEFSSKTFRKMKISEKFLDEFSTICQ